MPKNIEIKAKAVDWERQLDRAKHLSSRAEYLSQEDVFFHCPNGRLKLRVLGSGEAFLIFYQRPDMAGPKLSEYHIAAVADAPVLRHTLDAAFGQISIVRKQRTVFHLGQTRIHFDEVEGLGRFIEIEVVLTDGQRCVDAEAVAENSMHELGISQDDLVKGAYADLYESKAY